MPVQYAVEAPGIAGGSPFAPPFVGGGTCMYSLLFYLSERRYNIRKRGFFNGPIVPNGVGGGAIVYSFLLYLIYFDMLFI